MSNTSVASSELSVERVESPISVTQMNENIDSQDSQIDENIGSQIAVYSEGDELLAKQMGVSVPEMWEVLETINLQDPYERQPEYSPEWPTDFIGNGFYARNYNWVQENISEMHDEVPLHKNPHIFNSINVSVDVSDDEYEIK